MDYTKMSDEEFIDYIRECYNANDLELYKHLCEDSYFCERVKKMRDEHIAYGNDYKLCNIVPNMDLSYKNLCTLLKIVRDSNYIKSDEERKNIMSNICETGNFHAMRLFNEEDKNIIRFFKEKYYSGIYQYDQISYSVKKMLEIFKKYNNIEYCFAYLHDELKIDGDTFFGFAHSVKELYFKSIVYAKNNLYNEVSFSDIMFIVNMKSEYAIFLERFKRFKHSNSFKEELNKEEYYKLEKFIEFVEEFLERNNNNFYELVNYIAIELKIDIDTFKNEYLNKYASLLLTKKDSSNINMKVFATLSNIYNSYLDLTKKMKRLRDVICGDSEDRDRIIEISYNLKFFNHVTPSETSSAFNDSNHLVDTQEDIDKIHAYLKNYGNFYAIQKKEKMKQQKLIEQEELENQQKNNIEEYVKIVKGFIDNKEKKIDNYLSNCGLFRAQFDEAVEVLRKFEHPIYEEYLKYVDNIRKINFAILLTSAKKVIELIKQGVQISETETRPFNLLDYYENTTIATDNFLKIISGKVSREDYVIASKFLVKYKNEKILEANQIGMLLAQEISYATEVDKDDNIISKYDVTKEDKEQVIFILRERGIPITRSTYAIMLRTYIFSEVLKIEPKQKVKK